MMHTVRARALTLVLSATFPALLGAQSPSRPAQGAPPADTARPQSRTLQSWTSDRVRLSVGDIVTVLVDERTLASASLNDSHADKRSKNMGLDIEPPAKAGAPPVPMAATAKFDNNGDSQRQGEATRSNGFQAEMSARVIAVSNTGMLQIRGTKLVTVDKNKQEIVVTGWIRPQDIAGATNTVESWRLADAEITYGQKGGLGKPKSGLISKMVGWIWP